MPTDPTTRPPLARDPVTAAGLTVRAVRRGSRDGVPTRIAVARRTYPTDREDLWNALTDPERLPRWFLPVTGDLTEGGRYQTEGNAGGVVERCRAPESFSVTWEFGPMMSWLSVELTAGPAGGTATTLELTHEAPVDPEMWGRFGPGAVGVGWDLALLGLGLHLASGEAVDPEAGQGFPLTPEGLTFVREAASGWAGAAIADGDPDEVARAAAGNTVAFYTTVPDGPDLHDLPESES